MYMYLHIACTDVTLQKVFYNSQPSVGDRQYTIMLFISIICLPTILNCINDRETGAIIFCRILALPPPPPQYPPSPDTTILNYFNDR